MALTAPQQVEFDKAQAELAEIKAAVKEISDVVYDSLSIQNVGGSHIFNLGVSLQKKIVALETHLTAIEAL